MTRYERAVYNMARFGTRISEYARHERTWMTMFLPFGDQLIDTFSPCSANEVDVRARCASTAEGWLTAIIIGLSLVLRDLLTLTRHADRPPLVRVQKRLLRGLGDRQMTDSLATGRAGAVDSCLAAELGKYMAFRCRPAAGRLGTLTRKWRRHA